MGTLGLNTSEDADLGLKNFGGASKTRHSETPKAGSESVNAHDLKPTLNAKDTLCIGALLHRRQIFDWKHHALVVISYVKNLRNRRSLLVPLRGFTLAEVLITLGIIGVVAALAIPTLISNNNKRIVETRLAKFYSNMNQAVELSEVENGSKEKWEVQPYGTNTEEALAWYNKYFGPYLKVTKIITSDNSSTLDIFFPDGSALRMNNIASWHFFPKAETLETTPSYHSLIGKSVFTFKFAPSYSHLPFHYKKGVEPYKDGWNGTEDNLRTASNIGCNENATNEPAFCTELIRRNGWKIPDDYPFKF